MTNFIETSILDLVKWTEFVHSVRPSFKDKLVYGIEELKPGDRNIKFHLIDRVKQSDEEDEETQIFMLSAEYILQYYGELIDDDEYSGETKEESS